MGERPVDPARVSVLGPGEHLSFILVMLLHYLPRFSRKSEIIHSDFEQVVGGPPLSLQEFIGQHRTEFEQLRE